MSFNNFNGKIVPFYSGGVADNPANVIRVSGAPSSAAVEQPIGTIAIDPSTATVYCAASNSGLNGSVTWVALGGAASDVQQLGASSGTSPVAPAAGVITLNGTANQITATGGTNEITFSIPSAFVAPGSVTATTTVTATLGAITATNGNLVLGTAGNKLNIATGANASVGTATLATGSVTVSTTAVSASSIILISRNTPAGTVGDLSVPVGSIVAGTEFVINSASGTDTSTVNWLIIN